MNPFDLRGPDFLLFYVVLVAAVSGVTVLVRRVLESGPIPRFREVDPYLVAHLRGGSGEVLRVATISLLDRGFLQISGEHIEAEPGAAARVRRPVERAILAEFPRFLRGSSLLARSGPLAACAPFEDELRKLRLVPSSSQFLLRVLIGLGAVAILLGVAQHKIELALARGHDNIVFLVALAFLSPVAIILALHSRTTTVGRRMLQDFRTLFSRLRERAREIQPGGATNELALLAAVFGLDALRGVASMHARALFGKRLPDERRGRRRKDQDDSSSDHSSSPSCGSSSASSCGSSSASSCGSSSDSSGGGGGCGGCGGGGGD